jgi:hypothetical protein
LFLRTVNAVFEQSMTAPCSGREVVAQARGRC